MKRCADVRDSFLGRERMAATIREREDFEISVGRRQIEALGESLGKTDTLASMT